ncbi:hypothetical protein LP415_13730 [Polaromonas sp. P1(28)-8]|nr:hypothetical protein LP415_13730 [Polaromonas sp. P1(28)-8]
MANCPNESDSTLRAKKSLYGLLALALLIAVDVAAGQSQELASEQSAAALLKKHEVLTEQLAHNPYRRPLVLDSSETPNSVNGNAYAVLDSPFSTFSATFKSPHHWCDVLILHLNTKYCRASADTSPSKLKMRIGKKISAGTQRCIRT